jgi:hypothetical protein
MDQKPEQRRGEPGMGTNLPPDQSPVGDVAVTLGGTDAGVQTGPNPTVGTPHTATPPPPPAVIHQAGEGQPGEANPAREVTTPTGQPMGSTADFLAAREAAEEAISRGESSAISYGDSGIGENVVVTRPDQADQQQLRLGANDANRVLDAPHSDMALGSLGHLYDATNARVDAKNEANAKVIQQAESMSGLDSGRNDYERMEYGEAQMNEVRDEVTTTGTHSMGIPQPAAPAANVLAIFSGLPQARHAVRALQDIGIAARDIQVAGGDWAGTADDPQFSSDYSDSAAAYGSAAAAGAAQPGGTAATASAGGAGGEVQLSVRTDRLTHGPVRRVLADNGATEVH